MDYNDNDDNEYDDDEFDAIICSVDEDMIAGESLITFNYHTADDAAHRIRSIHCHASCT